MHALYRVLFSLFFCLITIETQANPSSWHFNANDVNALHNQTADYRIQYGNSPLQFADLRLPHTSGPYPVAIIIHGGCWMSKFANLQNTAALADALRDLGIATWNIEYRGVDDVGGGWPGTFTDVAQAADFIKKIAIQYSLNLNQVIVIGQSAGGHLALWLAARHRLLPGSQLYTKNPLSLRGVIALGGVPDLKAFRQQAERVCNQDVIAKLLGDSPEQLENRYKETSPKELLPLGMPQILIYGAEDQVVPTQFGRSYMNFASDKKDSVKLIEVEYAAHHEYNVPNAVTWPVIRNAVSSFLKI